MQFSTTDNANTNASAAGRGVSGIGIRCFQPRRQTRARLRFAAWLARHLPQGASGIGMPRSTATAVMLFCGEPSMTRSE